MCKVFENVTTLNGLFHSAVKIDSKNLILRIFPQYDSYNTILNKKKDNCPIKQIKS